MLIHTTIEYRFLARNTMAKTYLSNKLWPQAPKRDGSSKSNLKILVCKVEDLGVSVAFCHSKVRCYPTVRTKLKKNWQALCDIFHVSLWRICLTQGHWLLAQAPLFKHSIVQIENRDKQYQEIVVVLFCELWQRIAVHKKENDKENATFSALRITAVIDFGSVSEYLDGISYREAPGKPQLGTLTFS